MSDPDSLPPYLVDSDDALGADGDPDADADDDLADDDDGAPGAGGGSRGLNVFTRRGKLPGSPARRSRTLPVFLALAVLLGAVAGFVARGFVSPAQEAANTQAPQASLITAQVRFGVLPVLVTMRADIVTGHSESVGAPSDLNGALAVVTSVGVKPGERVGQGTLLATVAERPVFLFQGKIPVFRPMTPGIHGPDVAQLQVGLADAGFGTGSDPSGVYGPGTAAAVAALYKAHGLQAASGGSTRQPSKAKRAPSAEIPMGEVLFVPRLPVRIGSAAHLGQAVSSGKPVVTLTTGRVTLTGAAGPTQTSLLRRGMTASAISDFTGRHFPVRIIAVHPPHVVFVPVGRLPAGMGNQNVEVSVTTSRVRTFIVPVAAVSTAGNGQTFITVATGQGNQTRQVFVRLGLVTGGQQAVTPLRSGSLRAGDLVVLGIATSQSKSKSKSRSQRGFIVPGGTKFSAAPVPVPGP
jgi:peptidoglycan hydrolase-like protein with peptidoglycan-binding domain